MEQGDDQRRPARGPGPHAPARSGKALFLTPVNPPIVNRRDEVAENSRITPTEEAPRRESLGDSRTIQGATVAGGAGAAASTIGKDSAEELDQIETNIEQGTGLTEKPAGEGGLGTRDFESFIDDMAGGPGEGWFRIVERAYPIASAVSLEYGSGAPWTARRVR